MGNNHQDTGEHRLNESLTSIAEGVFECLGKTFPVCCWSDEFHYFPQIIPPQGLWTGWREAIRKTPLPALSAGGPLEMYRKEADNLLGHCIDRGIVPEDLPGISPLRISMLPPPISYFKR